MSPQLIQEIQCYLDSFDDSEELDIFEMSELFYRANTLLVKVIEEEKGGNK